jgi:hypothetical protein
VERYGAAPATVTAADRATEASLGPAAETGPLLGIGAAALLAGLLLAGLRLAARRLA